MMKSSTFILAILLMMASSLVAEERRTRIETSVLCGVLTDLAGTPIAKGTIAAMWADFGTATKTDQSGRWTFGSGAGPHWMKVDAEGYETFIFDYVDKADPKSNGAEKPAFIMPGKDGACPTPIYVRLAPRNSDAGFVTLDPAKSVPKENKAK